MERIGIFGGIFNPIHSGHVQAAKLAAEALKLDKLLLVPAGLAPHKPLPEGSPTGQQRLEMAQLAACTLPKIQVSDLELRREGPSYTWQTVAQVRQQYPTAELVLFMGTDMFLSFASWKRPEKILQEASLGVFYRGQKDEVEQIAAVKASMEAGGARVYLVKNPVLAISSTDLRRLLVFQCADPYLPQGVGAYIREKGLYGTARNLQKLPLEALEQTVVSLLKPNRVAHVLGCRDTAVALARRWGADETDAARAALLHDITKALDGPLQLTLCRQYGIILTDFSSQNAKTLHALTGAWVARRIFGENAAVFSAIESHTTGKANMNTLEKLIYVADYMEPNRDFPGVEKLRILAETDLDGAMLLGLEMTLAVLKEQGREVSPGSWEALAYFRKRRNLC